MKIVAVNASANKDGLTAMSATAFLAGAEEAGAQVNLIHLKECELQRCRMCAGGWGTCRELANCVIADDFERVRREILEADAWVLATPVYFGDLSELAKALMDRLRRCNIGPRGGQFKGKDFVALAAAGGSGRGLGTCDEALERIAGHMGMRLADLINVTRRSKLYQVDALKAAGRALVEQAWEE
ncbi:MAG: flavodoxin family protein [Armatimonadota bacterium]